MPTYATAIADYVSTLTGGWWNTTGIGDYISTCTGGWWKRGSALIAINIEQALVEYLRGYPTVAALVGLRIYPMAVPQGVTGSVLVIQRIATRHIHSSDGSSGVAAARFQITAWADTFSAVVTLADVLRRALDGFNMLWNTIRIHHCLLIGDWPTEEPSAEAEELKSYGHHMDFDIFHEEPLPEL